AWEIRIIAGEEEARLTFLGLRDDLPAGGRATIVDIGGGSTEIIAADVGAVDQAFSIPIGSGRVADRWFHRDPPGKESLRLAEEDARTFLADHAALLAGRGGTALFSGGNGQFLEGMRAHYGFGEVLDVEAIRGVLARLADEPAETVASVLGIQHERAMVLPAGVAIALAAAEAIAPDAVRAVPSGIRIGLLRDFIDHEGFGLLA
ncbi:MAG: Ppx/GppA phosphatase family protein, partial [Thermomicrobiales bacterium]